MDTVAPYEEVVGILEDEIAPFFMEHCTLWRECFNLSHFSCLLTPLLSDSSTLAAHTYQALLKMSLFEALYGRKCNTQVS
jgi:hypothetical protein